PEWVLFLDADEVATPEFRQAVADAIQNAGDSIAGFYCCWKTMLGQRWLRRSDSFPKWQLRIVRRGRANFIDSGHGQKEGSVEGERSEEHTSELQSRSDLVCRLLLEKKK